MRVIKDFEASLKNLSPPTKRAYLAGAKSVLRAAFAGSDPCGGCASYAELWARIRDFKPQKPIRARPFLRFVESPQGPASPEALQSIRRWVIEALANRLQKNPSLTSRRDAALLAALCAAPARGNPRAWPKSCLAVTQSRVRLWEKDVQEPALGLALRHWHRWQERLSRPDQRRLYRKALTWSHSALLFPGPSGAPLGRAALHNALRRLERVGEGRSAGLTPEKIRSAFLAGGERLPTRAV
jgi:hypothetical protein